MARLLGTPGNAVWKRIPSPLVKFPTSLKCRPPCGFMHTPAVVYPCKDVALVPEVATASYLVTRATAAVNTIAKR